jgi:hypothetical protein
MWGLRLTLLTSRIFKSTKPVNFGKFFGNVLIAFYLGSKLR